MTMRPDILNEISKHLLIEWNLLYYQFFNNSSILRGHKYEGKKVSSSSPFSMQFNRYFSSKHS